jgi:hypothetical protein
MQEEVVVEVLIQVILPLVELVVVVTVVMVRLLNLQMEQQILVVEVVVHPQTMEQAVVLVL